MSPWEDDAEGLERSLCFRLRCPVSGSEEAEAAAVSTRRVVEDPKGWEVEGIGLEEAG